MQDTARPDEPPLASPQHGQQQQQQLQGQPSKPLAGAALAGLSGPAGTPSTRVCVCAGRTSPSSWQTDSPPAQAGQAKPPSAAPGSAGPPSLTPPRLTAQDIATLAARFTNKPISEGYEVEARTTLEFSLSEPAVRHALTALQSLYKTLEDHGHEFPHGRLAVPTVYHGLQEYNNAIVNLADKLAVMDRRSCEVALVCCRLFISIGTITRDYTAVAEHYIRGMRIMHEAATRPYLDARGNVIPTQNGEFPKIDIFMIKIFMSPDRMAPACKEAALAIGRRRRLPHGIISKLALQHFDNVSRLRPGADASKVLAEKDVLVTMLADLNLDRQDGPRQLGAYHGRFHFLYHSALTIAVKLSLWAPTDDISELKPVFERVSAVSGCVI
ncbi:unnamed protein product [Parascedosporium putredinis]|uniref:Uncharacterized protein n=1 Tax=Parascedosporium putredinis TaxID=1442378 RepID=A0A9P1GZU9_9PEZI|nr:unnamed protein product [Parascedosporium putredinis]CAI7991135.1 unnamed protein product [Parascedosporium putredinis]